MNSFECDDKRCKNNNSGLCANLEKNPELENGTKFVCWQFIKCDDEGNKNLMKNIIARMPTAEECGIKFK